MSSQRPERKFALTKVATGDYLLLSNDGKTLWRIRVYEDGPSYGLDPEVFPKDFTRWGLWRWPEPVDAASTVDINDQDRWDLYEQHLETRQDGIDAALKAGGR